MFSNGEKKLSITYDDFSIKLLASKKGQIEKGITYQIPLEAGIIVNGLIEEEDALFSILKEVFKKLKLKKYNIRFLAPNRFVFMKKIILSGENDSGQSLKTYVEEKIGDTIHLPFEHPIVDLHETHSEEGEISIFAAEEEEVVKWQSIFEDLGHNPEAVDIEILADLRVLEQVIPDFMEQTQLVINWSKSDFMLAVVQNGNVEYMKHHLLKTTFNEWHIQQDSDDDISFELLEVNEGSYNRELDLAIEEVKKAIHFYQFSLNRGSKEIHRIINLGDNPMLDILTTRLKSEFTPSVTELTQTEMAQRFPTYDAKYATLVGLAIKEVNK